MQRRVWRLGSNVEATRLGNLEAEKGHSASAAVLYLFVLPVIGFPWDFVLIDATWEAVDVGATVRNGLRSAGLTVYSSVRAELLITPAGRELQAHHTPRALRYLGTL